MTDQLLELIDSMMFSQHNISQMDLSYETVDTIEEFTVELQVLYFESIKGVGENAGGESIS